MLNVTHLSSFSGSDLALITGGLTLGTILGIGRGYATSHLARRCRGCLAERHGRPGASLGPVGSSPDRLERRRRSPGGQSGGELLGDPTVLRRDSRGSKRDRFRPDAGRLARSSRNESRWSVSRATLEQSRRVGWFEGLGADRNHNVLSTAGLQTTVGTHGWAHLPETSVAGPQDRLVDEQR